MLERELARLLVLVLVEERAVILDRLALLPRWDFGLGGALVELFDGLEELRLVELAILVAIV